MIDRRDASPGTVQKAPTRCRFRPLVAPGGARLDRRNYAKKLAAAAAAAAAAGVVVARAFGRFQLGVDSFFVEALVVEFALLGVAEDV